MNQASGARRYEVAAESSSTFGRVLCHARNHHFVVDGPAANGCPGEALTPPEIFLAGVASCGVELVQVLARDGGVPLTGVRVAIAGLLDRSRPVRPDLTLFNSVQLEFELDGVDPTQAQALVEDFKRR